MRLQAVGQAAQTGGGAPRVGAYPGCVTASPARWLRAGALAGSSVGLATGAHFLGGGHADPVFLLLLLVAAGVGAYHWTRSERGLLAIVTAVLVVQGAVHLTLGLGHSHAGGGMLGAHLAAALLLALFLRSGEARLYAAARRRYLQWLVALRLALAGEPAQPVAARPIWTIPALRDVWTPGGVAGRGPPAAACL